MILAHMGNWEVLAQVGNYLSPDHPQAALYRPLNNIYIDAVIKRRRQSKGTQLISRKDGINTPMKILKEGGTLGVLCDQRIHHSGVFTPFFGRITSVTPLPYILKKRAKAHAIGISVITTAPGKWTVKCDHIIEADTPANAADFAHITESVMREAPMDCFWLQDRWKAKPSPLARMGKSPVLMGLALDTVIHAQHYAVIVNADSLYSEELYEYLSRLPMIQPDLHCHILFPDTDDLPDDEDTISYHSYSQLYSDASPNTQIDLANTLIALDREFNLQFIIHTEEEPFSPLPISQYIKVDPTMTAKQFSTSHKVAKIKLDN